MNMHAPAGTSLIADLRPEARNAPESGIVEVVNHGRLKPGLIPLWVGEGDLPTPEFIVRAANKSLADGETFYTWQRGIPELREALARYHTALYGRPFAADRFYVTGSGMQSVQIAVRLIAGVGDELIVPTPAWPNFAAAMGVAGANPVCVPMEFRDGRFTLDLERLEAAISPRTRAFVINSPANPTGWTATRDELAAILAIARRHGIWIIADEIYARFVYDGSARAASFHDVMEQEDRVLFVQTFSKNWAMTGWRVGWIEAPPAFGQIVENLIQYSTSGSPVFVQRAAVAALEEGEPFVAEQIARATEGRRIVAEGLKATNRVALQAPDGAFYQFFSVDGWTDSRRLALDLVDKANVGLAPGTAFGPGGETGLRFCFARKASDLVEAVARLQRALAD
ncbi:pyridoxal phosphate-dependent aminotransferase [Bosea sp. CS1GBMeth4]|uniref:pyridoxal phosphate-dependent aminotransferase n=1 Tax=Bosea sp. CS1GBMeth4 TaxID=1892849 RepID=UPI00164835D7|nr:pyridoxal phosphate-dependent aminotransferase [Bosea sp. CS1GBMeth4]